MRPRFTLVAAAIAAVAVLAPTAATVPPVKDSSFLREAVTVDGIGEHQAAFQAIADANGGTRASGTSGFDASVDYVVDRLTAAGYRPAVQEFEFAFFQQTVPSAFDQVSPTPTSYAEGPDFALMDYWETAKSPARSCRRTTSSSRPPRRRARPRAAKPRTSLRLLPRTRWR